MNISKPNYYLQASLAVLILSMTFAGQTRAEPTIRLVDGATTVQLSADLTNALAGLSVTPAATQPATLSDDGIATFPIVGGGIDLETNIGDILHTGGLSFSVADGTTVDLFSFIIDNTPSDKGSNSSAKDPAATNTTVQPANDNNAAGNTGTNATDTDPAATNTTTQPVNNNDGGADKKTTLTGLAALNDDLAGRFPLFNLDFNNAVVESNDTESDTDTTSVTDVKVTGVEMSLTKEGADALNAAFNVNAFTENLNIGTANIEGLTDATNDIGDEADDVADEADDVADDVADEADDVADEVGL
jgi:hypothetical protein